LTDQGVPVPEWILDVDGNVTCTPEGLYSPKLLVGRGCIEVGQQIISLGGGQEQSQFSPILTVANPSPTRSAMVQASVLFGTTQLEPLGVDFNGQGTLIQVTDRVGFGASGTITPGTYGVVNTASWTYNPSFTSPSAFISYNACASNRWLCPFALAPGQSIDLAFERRVNVFGVNGTATLRPTFLYLGLIAT